MNNVLNHLKAWWTAHTSVILTVAYFFVPSVQNFINTHPRSTVGGILGIVLASLFKQSPIQKGPSS